MTGVFGVLRGHRKLRQDRATVIDVLLEERAHAPQERLALDGVAGVLGQRVECDAQVALLGKVVLDAHAI